MRIRIRIITLMQIQIPLLNFFAALHGSIWSLGCSWILTLMWIRTYPAFHSNADPDPASQSNAYFLHPWCCTTILICDICKPVFISRIVFENESVSCFCFGSCRSSRTKIDLKCYNKFFYRVLSRITHCERITVMMINWTVYRHFQLGM